MPNFDKGQWFRMGIPMMDEADYGERHAEAGTLAFVDKVHPRQENCYSVVAFPSAVTCFMSDSELMNSESMNLAATSPAIPAPYEIELWSSILDLYYGSTEDPDLDTAQVILSDEQVQRVIKAAKGSALEDAVASTFKDMSKEEDGNHVSMHAIDVLAKMIGIGDRFLAVDNLEVKQVPELFTRAYKLSLSKTPASPAP